MWHQNGVQLIKVAYLCILPVYLIVAAATPIHFNKPCNLLAKVHLLTINNEWIFYIYVFWKGRGILIKNEFKKYLYTTSCLPYAIFKIYYLHLFQRPIMFFWQKSKIAHAKFAKKFCTQYSLRYRFLIKWQ